MSEEDIRNFINKSKPSQKKLVPRSRPLRTRMPRRAPTENQEAGYKDFSATHLFCPKCQQATPVREKIILYLPDGDLFDYSCTQCGTSVGTRKAGRD